MRYATMMLTAIVVLGSAPGGGGSLTDTDLEATLAIVAAYLRGDFETARELALPLAERGNRYAQGYLGDIFYYGKGVPQDYATAIHWYRRSAEQGLPSTQKQLGEMYENGQGTHQDLVHAHMWYSLAAAAGHEDAAAFRDSMATRMSAVQIDIAQRLAREWKPKSERAQAGRREP